MRLLTQGEDACNALAEPLTGSAHCALLRVVIRLAGLLRNGALALSKELTALSAASEFARTKALRAYFLHGPIA
jgi:hypothetical protein